MIQLWWGYITVVKNVYYITIMVYWEINRRYILKKEVDISLDISFVKYVNEVFVLNSPWKKSLL